MAGLLNDRISINGWHSLPIDLLQSIISCLRAQQENSLRHHKGLSVLCLVNKHWCQAVDESIRKLYLAKDIKRAGLFRLSQRFRYVTTLSLKDCNSDAVMVLPCFRSSLTHLYIKTYKEITKSAASAISSIRTLEHLTIWSTSLSDSTLQLVATLPSLGHLALTGSLNVTDDGMQIIGNCQAPIQSLELHGLCNVTDKGLMDLTQLTSLTFLDLSGCDRITDRGLKSLTGLPSLSELILYDCSRITNAGLNWLSVMTSLTHLDIGVESVPLGEKITDEDVQPLVGLSILKSLDIRGRDSITESGLSFLRQSMPQIVIVR